MEFLWTDIHAPTWYIPFFFTNVASNSIQVLVSEILDLSLAVKFICPYNQSQIFLLRGVEGKREK